MKVAVFSSVVGHCEVLLCKVAGLCSQPHAAGLEFDRSHSMMQLQINNQNAQMLPGIGSDARARMPGRLTDRRIGSLAQCDCHDCL